MACRDLSTPVGFDAPRRLQPRAAVAALLLSAALSIGGGAHAVSIPLNTPEVGLWRPPEEKASQPADNAFSRRMEAGQAAMAKRAYEEARGHFEAAARLDAQSPLPALALAEVFRVRGQPNEIKRWLDKAGSVAPKDVAVLTARARWAYAQRNYKAAEQLWRQAMAADPKATGPLVDLGDYTAGVLNKPADAAQHYRAALAINPKLAGAHHALGVMLSRQGQTDAALAELQEAAKLSPGNPLPLHVMGQVQAAAGKTDAALASFDQALKAQPDFHDARLDKGDVLMAAGRTEAALAEYQAVVKAVPHLATALVRLGQAQQQLGRKADAMRAYQSAIAQQPKLAVALNNMAWLAAEGEGQVTDRGLRWAEQAVALNAEQPQFQGTLAWVHFKRGDAAKAQQVLEKLTQGVGKRSAEAHHLLGLVLAERGQAAASAAAFKEALRLNPSYAQAAEARARLQSADKPATSEKSDKSGKADKASKTPG